MRSHIATIAGLIVEQVSIKATTTEGLGFTGRSEGIAAQAVASIRMGLFD
jgi:2-C-methyl-D-erythritol 4-phosphate cytidylyltransferase/2-C-methyl-D-erythritol 2,4-cyclodiphosphate synthase